MAIFHLLVFVVITLHINLVSTTDVTRSNGFYTPLCKVYSFDKQKQSSLTDRPILDCSYRNLDTVPSPLYNASLELKLNNNKLSNITRSPFKELVLLNSLIMTNNSISYITNNAFFGLTKLHILDISYNKLPTLPTNIFSQLINLQVLDLGWNYLVKIPSEAVAPLHSLQVLGLIGNPFTSFFLGKEFKKLNNLELLVISNTYPSLQQDITN